MPETARLSPDDLDAYFRRIGREAGRRADPETLRGVHLAHIRSIPFENLDPVRGTVPSLAPADLMAKLVRGRRGGYCYEQNTLFAAVLEALGFRVTRLGARVVVGAERFQDRPRTHMVLLVEVPGDPRPYLTDVGFGAPGALLEPVPLTAGAEFHDGGRRHRLVHASHRGPLELWVLETYGPEKETEETEEKESREEGTPGGEAGEAGASPWQAQYAFTLEPFEHADFEVVNWYIATSPRSPFSRRPYAQRVTPDRHLLLSGTHLTETRADGTVTERELTEEREARRVLEEEFGISVPADTTLLS